MHKCVLRRVTALSTLCLTLHLFFSIPWDDKVLYFFDIPDTKFLPFGAFIAEIYSRRRACFIFIQHHRVIFGSRMELHRPGPCAPTRMEVVVKLYQLPSPFRPQSITSTADDMIKCFPRSLALGGRAPTGHQAQTNPSRHASERKCFVTAAACAALLILALQYLHCFPPSTFRRVSQQGLGAAPRPDMAHSCAMQIHAQFAYVIVINPRGRS